MQRRGQPSSPLHLNLVLVAQNDICTAIDVGRNKDLDWTTTYRAIFDGVLVVKAGFDNNIDRFTAVGAR